MAHDESQAKPALQIVRMKALRQLLGGMSKATIWREIARGRLPEPIHLSLRGRGWFVTDAERYVQQRRAEAEARQAARIQRMKKVAPGTVSAVPRAVVENDAGVPNGTTPNSERGTVQVGQRIRGLC